MEQIVRRKMMVTVDLEPRALTAKPDQRLGCVVGECLLELWDDSEQAQQRTLKGGGGVSYVSSHGELLYGERGIYLLDDERVMRPGEASSEMLVHALNVLHIELAIREARPR